MNATSSQPSSVLQHRSFRRPFATGLFLVALGSAVGAGLWHVHGRQQLADLERQLVLARGNGDAGAVGEIARRIARLDDSPARLLALSECFVQVRLFDDLEQALAEVERLAPERGHEVVRLRARAAVAKSEWEAGIAFWNEYLASAAVAAPDRVTALDEVVSILLRQGRWDQARACSDSRLALADAVEARLVRAQVAIRQRRWAAAREDFRHLKATAPADAAVKDVLPAWERIERALAELEAADATVNAAPAALRGRLERAQVCARLGLWQNAADDLQQAAVAYPSARLPGLFGATIGLHPSFTKGPARAVDGDFARALPWLASSRGLAGFLEYNDAQWLKWRQLAVLDVQLTAPTAGRDRTNAETTRLRAERAQVIGELGLNEPALNDALAILREVPNFLPAERVVIAALLASGNAVQAAGAVERALTAHAADPGAPDPELHRLAGLVWQAQGRHAQAVEALTSCLARARRADLLRARARSLRQLQRYAEAVQDNVAAEALETVSVKEGAQ